MIVDRSHIYHHSAFGESLKITRADEGSIAVRRKDAQQMDC
jgi:hypothetical protein